MCMCRLNPQKYKEVTALETCQKGHHQLANMLSISSRVNKIVKIHSTMRSCLCIALPGSGRACEPASANMHASHTTQSASAARLYVHDRFFLVYEAVTNRPWLICKTRG